MFHLRYCLFQIIKLKFYKLLNNLSGIAVCIKHSHSSLLFKFFILVVLNFLILLEYASARTVCQKYLKHRHSIFKLLILIWKYTDYILASAFLKFSQSNLILFFLIFFSKDGNYRLLENRRVAYLRTTQITSALAWICNYRRSIIAFRTALLIIILIICLILYLMFRASLLILTFIFLRHFCLRINWL